MGNLHAGHLSLVKQAQKLADKVVVSIFVNPLQFGKNEDFGTYPRTLEEDIQKLTAIAVDLVFTPQVDEVYPGGEESNNQTIVTPPGNFSNLLEGEKRPKHFDGVTTVVNKLFNMVQPDYAVFGQKDYQQWLVLNQMIVDFNMPITMVCADIERDVDGLALSSRNQYLSKKQRKIAPIIYQTLLKTKQDFTNAIDFKKLELDAIQKLLTAGFDKVDYYQILDANTLSLMDINTTRIVILTVARLGGTRLLDNIVLDL